MKFDKAKAYWFSLAASSETNVIFLYFQEILNRRSSPSLQKPTQWVARKFRYLASPMSATDRLVRNHTPLHMIIDPRAAGDLAERATLWGKNYPTDYLPNEAL